LIDGKIVFWTGEMNGRDQPKKAVVRLLECGFAGERLPPLDFRKATSLRISLFNQIALHF
jgi:hypothetical protein